MKVIKNDSLQSMTIYLNTEKGCHEQWLKPGESIVVPDSYVSEQILNLHRTKLFKISNTQENKLWQISLVLAYM